MIRTIIKFIAAGAILTIAPNPAGALLALFVYALIEAGEDDKEEEAKENP